MEVAYLLAALVLLPALCAGLCLVFRQKGLRNTLVVVTVLVMVLSSLYLAYLLQHAGGSLTLAPRAEVAEVIGWVIKLVDLTVLAYVIYRGVSAKRWISPLLAICQLIALVAFEVFGHVHEPAVPVAIDYLSLTLVLLASLIGPLILLFAIGYMERHEEHLHLMRSRQPRFFAILFLFLGVMNALAVADNLLWVYTFWEVTTLCSFLLIGHDETEESIRNAFRTLDLNMLGGVGFILGIITLYHVLGSISLSVISAQHLSGGAAGLLALGIAFLVFAGFTKSAQFPFQSWLLGAMVAPTPVSALLHSSTMVKAGVYLIVRLSSVMAGSMLGGVVAFAGGLTFVAASAIAISQSNGKRVLAYSTIANLGLIICCAGIGSHAALGAAILLMIFHALSKGLLFLCMGTIEQEIGSRDIEDMQGLLKKMPFTTFVMVIGMISMLLPPFGVLMTKWLAIEAAIHYPWVLLMLVMGSAFTVVFWAKWIGIILTMSYKPKYRMEKLLPSMRITLGTLLLGTLAASMAIAPLFNALIAPYLRSMSTDGGLKLTAGVDELQLFGAHATLVGGFSAVPIFMILFVLVIAIPYFIHRTRPEKVRPPYFGGELANNDIRGIDFIGPGDKVEQVVVHNFYLVNIFGENKLTFYVGVAALAVILVMFGVTL